MTSKEALENLYQGSLNPVNCLYATFRTGASNKITDDYNIIKKDLEVLEIIKKRQIDIKDIIDTIDDFELYQAYCIGKGYADEYICTKKEFKVLKRWLENDK